MSIINKDTLIPVSLVITAVGLTFQAGSMVSSLTARVEAIELDRREKNADFKSMIEKENEFQRQIIERLARIEQALKQND